MGVLILREVKLLERVFDCIQILGGEFSNAYRRHMGGVRTAYPTGSFEEFEVFYINRIWKVRQMPLAYSFLHAAVGTVSMY